MVNYNDPTLREDIKKAMEKAGIRNEDEVFMEEIRKKYGFNKQDNTVDNVVNNDNCYMTFNGKNLNLYKEGIQVNSIDGMSGNDMYQFRNYQNIKNLGPIPEGVYYAKQNNRQVIDPINALAGLIKKGNWQGSIPAWGLRRVWLTPDKNTNTFGRTGFSIHGGYSKGSAGCIDIPGKTGELSKYLDDCQETVPLYVNYPNEKW